MQPVRSLFATFLLAFAGAGIARPQVANRTFTPPGNDLNLIGRWDDLNQRMLYHRVALKPSSIGVYAVDLQGRQTLAIDVLKDFPGTVKGVVSTDNLAGGPQGSVVLFCVLDDNVRLKELILTYSAAGVLESAIDIGDYEASALTVDQQGNTYIFATNTAPDVDDPQAVYDTVVKYDPEGQVVTTMLSSSNFPAGDYFTNDGDRLRITSKGLAVFATSSGRWFLLSQQGEVITRSDLSDVRQNIADQRHFRRVTVLSTFLDPSGWPVFHLLLDDGPFTASNLPPPDQMRFQETLVKVNPATMAVTEIENDSSSRNAKKIPDGIDSQGNIVYSGIRLTTPQESLSSTAPK